MENKLHPRFEVHVLSVQSPGLPQLLVLPLWPLAHEPHFRNHFCKVTTLGSELGLEAVGVYRGGPLTHVDEAPRQGPGPMLSLLLRSQTEALSPPPSAHPWSRPPPTHTHTSIHHHCPLRHSTRSLLSPGHLQAAVTPRWACDHPDMFFVGTQLPWATEPLEWRLQGSPVLPLTRQPS